MFMKRGVRCISAILALLLMLGTMSACHPKLMRNRFWEIISPDEQNLETEGFLEETNREDSLLTESEADGEGAPEEDETEAESDLTYRLSEADVEAFYALLKACEEGFSDAAKTQEELDGLMSAVEVKYYDIMTQSQLAYIYYCCDMAN